MNTPVLLASIAKFLVSMFAGIMGFMIVFREFRIVGYTRWHRNRLICRPVFIWFSLGKMTFGIIAITLAMMIWFV